MTNFSIIIPNYNGASFLTNCLNSLKQAIDNCPNSEFEIILIDNNSKDDSLKIFEIIIPKNFNYRILLNSKNYGFASAVNQGIEKAKYEYVVLLNNDLTMEPNWFQLISKTIKKNKNPKIATFFGTVLNKEGTKFESQGLKFFYSGKCQNISNRDKFTPSLSKEGVGGGLVWGASAAFIVYNKKILKQIGLFDSDFFAYLEDVDLSLRLHNLNYQTFYIPKAISYHFGGGTSKTMKNIRSRLSYRNWFFIIIKNYSSKEFFTNFSNILIERCHNLSYFFKETISVYKWKSIIIFPFDFIKTSLEIFILLPKILKKRKTIQKLIKLNNLI
ncbi:MAG: glycosyltransferase family 2 protein [Candidatus Shapirobacteria bacterium]|jgi:GT2 family glycosyltransferase